MCSMNFCLLLTSMMFLCHIEHHVCIHIYLRIWWHFRQSSTWHILEDCRVTRMAACHCAIIQANSAGSPQGQQVAGSQSATPQTQNVSTKGQQVAGTSQSVTPQTQTVTTNVSQNAAPQTKPSTTKVDNSETTRKRVSNTEL